MKNFNLNNLYKKYFVTNNIESVPSKMKAVLQKGLGDANTLYVGETDTPNIKDKSEVLIKVVAFSLNRADLLQRQGKYPPPKGVTNILGLECSGYLVENGVVNKNKKIMALLPGGGYAEYVNVNKDHIMNIPNNLEIINAAAIPEAWITAYQLCSISGVKKDDRVLVHAAASGVGTSLIQLIKHYGAKSYGICSSEEKVSYCQKLGLNYGFLRRDEKRNDSILINTNKLGCSVILDCVGASEFENNTNVAGVDARWVNYASMGGNLVKEFNLSKFLGKRIQLNFTTLRSRSDEYKSNLISKFASEILPGFSKEEFRPIIDKIYTVDQIIEAHERMDQNKNIGKIIVKWI